MSTTIIVSMITLSFAMSISPGPINILIISSSMNYGFKKTFAFVSGAAFGFTFLLIFIGFGFMSFLVKYPIFLKILSIFGAIFIIYMGYKISFSKLSIDIKFQEKKTLYFYEGFLLQWINPKAWMASISGIAIYSTTQEILYSFIIIYFVVCYLSLIFWAVVGKSANRFLNTNRRLKIFNFIMGGLLIICACYLLISEIM